MADKEITNLPQASGIYDDAQLPCYVPGASEPAQKVTGAQLREYAEAAGAAAAGHVQKGEKGDPGDVSSVNGVEPDDAGNVQLTPADIGAAPATHASQHASGGSDPITPAGIGALAESAPLATDCNTHLTAGGNKILVARYATTTLNSPYSEGLVSDAGGLVITFAYTTTYGRQLCLCASSGGTCERYIKAGAVSKWVRLATTDYAVNKAGDTMTGDLKVDKSNGSVVSLFPYGSRTWVRNKIDDNNYHDIKFGADQLAYAGKIDSVDFAYNILHTGYKPSDSYTGNGDATARTIETGGTGSAVLINGYGGLAIVTTNGAIGRSGASAFVLTASEAKFASGVLTLATTNAVLNMNGMTTYYQVL